MVYEFRFSNTPATYSRASPILGEHTDAVLAERLGLSEEAIAELRAKRVI